MHQFVKFGCLLLWHVQGFIVLPPLLHCLDVDSTMHHSLLGTKRQKRTKGYELLHIGHKFSIFEFIKELPLCIRFYPEIEKLLLSVKGRNVNLTGIIEKYFT